VKERPLHRGAGWWEVLSSRTDFTIINLKGGVVRKFNWVRSDNVLFNQQMGVKTKLTIDDKELKGGNSCGLKRERRNGGESSNVV